MTAPFAQTLRSLEADDWRRAHLVWAVSGVLLVGWGLWFGLSSMTVYAVSQRARIEVLRAPHQIEAQIAGKIVSTSLVLGRDVSERDVLVEIDSSRDQLRLAEEQARLGGYADRVAALAREIEAREQSKLADREAARSASAVAEAHLEENQAAVEFARGAQQRQTKLVDSGASTRVEVLRANAEMQKLQAIGRAYEADAVRIQRDAASRDAQNQAQIEALRNTLASLKAEAATSAATVARLEAELARYRLRSPITGRLADVAPFRVGSYVAEGQRLATVLPPDDLMIVAEFPPSFAFGRLRAGQSARFRLDGFPWAQYGTISATVTRVAGEIRDNLVRVELRVGEVPDSGIVLQHGLPGNVEVAVEEAAPAALVLRSAGLILSPAAPASMSGPAGAHP